MRPFEAFLKTRKGHEGIQTRLGMKSLCCTYIERFETFANVFMYFGKVFFKRYKKIGDAYIARKLSKNN